MEENSKIKGTFADRPPNFAIFTAEVPDGGSPPAAAIPAVGAADLKGKEREKWRGRPCALTGGEIVAGDEAEKGARRRGGSAYSGEVDRREQGTRESEDWPESLRETRRSSRA